MNYSRLFHSLILIIVSLNLYPQESKAQFAPPKDAPQNSSRGTGGRGECDGVDLVMEPFIPLNAWGLTLEAYPDVWVYVKYYSQPAGKNIRGTFTLQQRKPAKNPATQSTVDLPNKSSLLRIPIPISLQDKAWYQWTLELSCKNQLNTPTYTSGVIGRISSPDLKPRLDNSSSSDLISIYDKQYLWYDVLNKTIQLRCANPSNSSHTTTWMHLMKMEKVKLSDDASQVNLVCK